MLTNTFGSNRYKLAGRYTVEETVNVAVAAAKRAAEAEREARMAELEGRCAAESAVGGADPKRPGPWVGLDVAPIGKLMAPAGDLEFEDAVTMFKELITAGVNAGVDLIMLETFTDIYELKAALVAAREVTDLPVFASVTFQEDGRMLMGTDPLTAVAILQDLGADVIGLNCSLGPKQMVPLVRQFLKYSKLPVIFQPNAGLPQIDENGNTVFTVGPEEYAETMLQMIGEGVAVAGGCCGTTPDHIAALRKGLEKADFRPDRLVRPKGMAAVCSATKTVLLDDGRVHVIGERINPTGKKLLKEALRSGNLAYIENEATAQVAGGAEILDVNVGLPDIDEKTMMLEAVKRISGLVDAPLQMDSADPEVLELAVRRYNGKPIINSVNGKQENMDAVLPIAAKYGASIIALTLDERGLPKNAEERVEIAEKIIKEAAKYGIGPERILADCLTLTVSAQQEAGLDTLKAIGMVKEKFGVKTVLGASNVSFGLPRRKLVNRTFLAMALMAGLDAPITDPLEPEYMGTIRA
ncbi:MAG: homocysteine S-methyltransferase family protein, partial [Firmicutes bacterium]|nr:homocysteine S-methyltransferase family protein [Bacillota bacterium]